jgi:hypothetical protein
MMKGTPCSSRDHASLKTILPAGAIPRSGFVHGCKAATDGRENGRRNWAESTPAGYASGGTGVRAKAVIPWRARNSLPPSGRQPRASRLPT